MSCPTLEISIFPRPSCVTKNFTSAGCNPQGLCSGHICHLPSESGPLWVVVGIYSDHIIVCKRTDTVVTFTQGYSKVSYSHGTCVYNLRTGFFQGKQLNGRYRIERWVSYLNEVMVKLYQFLRHWRTPGLPRKLCPIALGWHHLPPASTTRETPTNKGNLLPRYRCR